LKDGIARRAEARGSPYNVSSEKVGASYEDFADFELTWV
jgi:hypothetical protein